MYAFLLARDLFGSETAPGFVVLMNITILFTAGSIIATPDTPMMFFLAGAVYYFHKAVAQGAAAWWLLAGLFTGLAILSKYMAILVYGSFFLYLVLVPTNRKWLARAIPYVAFLLSAVIFLPVVIWNMRNGWVSFRFQAGHGFGGTFPDLGSFLSFLGSQAAVVGPILFILFLAALVHGVLRGRSSSAADRYQIASEIELYGHRPVVCLDICRRASQYDIWQREESFEGQSFLNFEKRPRLKTLVREAFERTELIATINLKRGARTCRQVFVFQAVNLRSAEGIEHG